MPIKTHTCVTLACDVCGETFSPDDYDTHFGSLNEARDVSTSLGWTITADRKIICHVHDAAHQAAFDAMLPPEPVAQLPGQLGLDGSEES